VTIGQNWQKWSGDVNVVQNGDGSVTIAGGGNGYNAQAVTYSFQGNGTKTAFGGGGYFEATLSWANDYNGWGMSGSNGWPSWWTNVIDPIPWPGQGGSGYINSIEPDVMEFWGNNNYGSALHDWYGDPNGGADDVVQGAASDLPAGFDHSKPHRYGMLWVPATPTSKGYVKFYFDGVHRDGGDIYWDMYDPNQPPPPVVGSTAGSVLDKEHIELLLGSGSNNPETVYKVQVWQASNANDIGATSNNSSGGGTPSSSSTQSPPVQAVGGSGVVTIIADQSMVEPGTTVNITWTSVLATSCKGSNFKTTGVAGFTSVVVNQTTTYSVTCNGAFGPQSAAITVQVGTYTPPTPTPTPTPTPSGGGNGNCNAVPSAAAAVGYNTQVVCGPIKLGGGTWAAIPGANVTQNSDGTITIAGGGTDYNSQVGITHTFSGGFYSQATVSWPGDAHWLPGNGWPAFWATDAAAGGTGVTVVEADFMEAMYGAAGYNGNLINWYPDGSNTGSGGPDPAAIPVPAGTDFSKPNTFGFMDIPPTASAQGHAIFYFNGKQVKDVPISQGGLYSRLFTEPLTVMVGSGTVNPMTVYDVQVWQASNTSGGGTTPTPSPSPTPVSTSGSLSAFGASVTAGNGTLTDYMGHKWTLTSAGQVLQDGKNMNASPANLLVYDNYVVYERTTSGQWFLWAGIQWMSVQGDPRGGGTTPAPTPTPTPTPSGGGGNDCGAVPAAAAAAGYNNCTFGPNVTIGQNWLKWSDAVNVTQNGDGTVTIRGGANGFNAQLITARDDGSGTNFGGGGYFEATFSFTGAVSTDGGWPSFWGGSSPWTGDRIETDFVEWWGQNDAAANLHFWGADGSHESPGGTALPVTFDASQPHKYAMLWTTDSLTFYVDGVKGGTYPLTGPYAILNQQKIAMTLGSGPNNPMTVYGVRVWQKGSGGSGGTTQTPSSNSNPPVISTAGTTFSDNFTFYDSSKWRIDSYDEGGAALWNNDPALVPQIYQYSNDGLRLNIINAPAGGHQYSTGMTNMHDPSNFSQLFGYFEITCAVPRVPGFMYEAEMRGAVHWPPAIDIARIYTLADGTQVVDMHDWSIDKVFSITSKQGFDATQMHSYGLDITADHMNFYIDRVLVDSNPNPGGLYQTEPIFLKMFDETGDYWPLQGVTVPPSALPVGALIRSFNVWASKPF
jgi:hypothetical protein